jgi:hypothetical protein
MLLKTSEGRTEKEKEYAEEEEEEEAEEKDSRRLDVYYVHVRCYYCSYG